jgi:ankyrin repeat protein
VDEDTIRSACSSLLRRVGRGVFQIAHFTVQEYLQSIDPNDPKIGKFRITEEDAKAALGQVLLTYLCMQDFGRPPPATISERVHRNKLYPLYHYAAYRWKDYAKGSCDNEDILRLSCHLFHPSKTYNFITFFLELATSSILDRSLNDDEYHKLVDEVASGGFRPLHAASLMCRPDICKYLVNKGSDVNQVSAIGIPLELAIGRCQLVGTLRIRKYVYKNRDDIHDTVAVLVDSGASYRLHNTERNCSLSFLTFVDDLGESGVFRCLLDKGMQISHDLLSWLESDDTESDDTDRKRKFLNTLDGANLSHLGAETKAHLLDIACRSGIKAPPVLLLGSPDTETVIDEHFQAMVYHAIKFDQPVELKRLMVDTRFRNDLILQREESRPLHLAAKSHSPQVMAILLDLDSSEKLTMHRESGMTVWHVAARWGGKECLDLLISRFGDQASGLTAKSDTGELPLTEAILGGDEVSALYLLEKTRLYNCNPSDPSLVYLSTTFGMRQLLDKLIENGFDPSISSSDRAHAMFCVSHVTPLELVETLISHGLSSESTRSDGKTPLHVILSLDMKCNPHPPTEINLVNAGVIGKLISNTIVYMVDEDGNVPWHYFCTTYLKKFGLTESCDTFCRVLIDHGALLAYERVTGKSAISLLIKSWCDRQEESNGELNRGSRLFSWCIDRHQTLESFLQDDEFTRVLVWSIEFDESLLDVLLANGVSVHARSIYAQEKSALDIACGGTSCEIIFPHMKRTLRYTNHRQT